MVLDIACGEGFGSAMIAEHAGKVWGEILTARPSAPHSGKGSTGLDYVQFLGSRIASGDLAAARTVHVVTTPHTEFIGEGLAAALRNTRLTVTRSTKMPAAFDHDLYIVVAPQMFATLPPPDKLIAVQVEQVRASRWVDESYLARLQNSLAILDYSRDNIDALIKRGIPSKQIYYMPIRPSWPPARCGALPWFAAIAWVARLCRQLQVPCNASPGTRPASSDHLRR